MLIQMEAKEIQYLVQAEQTALPLKMLKCIRNYFITTFFAFLSEVEVVL